MAEILATKLAEVRAAIKTRIGTVGGFTVYDYLRRIDDEATLKAIALDTGDRIHFWQFGVAPETPFEAHRYAAGETRVRVRWDLHGYYAVDDANASEKTFDTEAAAVFDAFEASNKKLSAGDGSDLTVECGPAQRVQGGHVMFSTVLCHYARMSLLTVLSLEC